MPSAAAPRASDIPAPSRFSEAFTIRTRPFLITTNADGFLVSFAPAPAGFCRCLPDFCMISAPPPANPTETEDTGKTVTPSELIFSPTTELAAAVDTILSAVNESTFTRVLSFAFFSPVGRLGLALPVPLLQRPCFPCTVDLPFDIFNYNV